MKFDAANFTVQGNESPSVRRAWIEIANEPPQSTLPAASPSVRRAWIEIGWPRLESLYGPVALREEGVD